MAELALAYRVRSYSTGTPGRAICNTRNHPLGWPTASGGDEVGAGELFLSGITACAVNMVERIAGGEENPPCTGLDVSVEAFRDPRPGPPSPTRGGRPRFTTTSRSTSRCGGLDDDQGQYLVDQWETPLTPSTVRSPCATPTTTVTAEIFC